MVSYARASSAFKLFQLLQLVDKKHFGIIFNTDMEFKKIRYKRRAYPVDGTEWRPSSVETNFVVYGDLNRLLSQRVGLMISIQIGLEEATLPVSYLIVLIAT